MHNIPVIAIDGPSGAGKGTVSRAIAKKLGWNYLDSGSIYRALAIYALDKQADLDNITLIAQLAGNMQLAFQCDDALVVLLEGADITAKLPSEEVGATASKIAAYPEVRAVLLQKQKDFCQFPGLVADGRDMGSVVFPNAMCKIFLTASAVERAKRRFKQLKEKGIYANLVKITEDIELRDQRDRERLAAPLKVSEGAFYIDSSDLSIDQVIVQIMALIEK